MVDAVAVTRIPRWRKLSRPSSVAFAIRSNQASQDSGCRAQSREPFIT